MQLSIPPASSPPAAGELRSAIARLRKELQNTDNSLRRATIEYELGVLEELSRDDHRAAQDLLGSVNASSELQEPLEHLIFLLERKSSHKNLPRLIERLIQVANAPEEIARAQAMWGDFLLDIRGDAAAAELAYTKALKATPEGRGIWLSTQVLAAQRGQPKQQAQALEQRARLAEGVPDYQSHLLFELAKVQEHLGDTAAAQDAIIRAAKNQGPTQLAAFKALERLARRVGNSELLRRALTEQVGWFEAQALAADEAGGGSARQLSGTSLEERAQLWVRICLLEARAQRRDAAAQALGLARTILPADPHLLQLQLSGVVGSWKQVKEWVSPEALPLLPAPLQSSIRFRQAQQQADGGQADQALSLLGLSVELAPHRLVPHALRLNLLEQAGGETDNAAALSAVAMALATSLPSGDGVDPPVPPAAEDLQAAASYEMLAAFVWATIPHEQRNASAALERAQRWGLGELQQLRAARTLAALAGSVEERLDSARSLLPVCEGTERVSLLLELVRSYWLQGEEDQAFEHLATLRQMPEGAELAALLRAYVLGGTPEEVDEAMDRLAHVEVLSGDASHSRFWACLRKELPADLLRSRLQQLHSQKPEDLPTALRLARSVAEEDSKQAASIVAESASRQRSSEVAAACWLLAALHSWAGDEREVARQHFESARNQHGGAGQAALAWAQRLIAPNDISGRRNLLAAPTQLELQRRMAALELFALEAAIPGRLDHATQAIDRLPPEILDASEDSGLDSALLLAQALWRPSVHHAESRKTLAVGTTGLQLDRVQAFMAERMTPTPNLELVEELAQRWAETGAAAGALEWLSSTLANSSANEVEARCAVGSHLKGSSRAALMASAQLVALLHGRPWHLPQESAEEASVRANLENTTPGAPPKARARNLRAVAEYQEKKDAARSALLAGYNELLAGQHRDALGCFQDCLEVFPEDLGAWEGLRAAAQVLGERALQADACAQLAERVRSSSKMASLHRERAKLLLELGQPDEAVASLQQAVTHNPGDQESARLLTQSLRQTGRFRELLELLQMRLKMTNSPEQTTELTWERARTHRSLEQFDAAQRDLETVALLEPSHRGVLTLSAEIHLTQGRIREGAALLAKLSSLDSAQKQERLQWGIAAADLYERKLQDLEAATGVLASLHESGIAGTAAVERLAKTTAKAQRWPEAAKLFEELMTRRGTAEGRAQAARLALVIHRDQLEQPRNAESACRALLEAEPRDPEALDFLLSGHLDSAVSHRLLHAALPVLQTRAVQERNPEDLARLARISEFLGERRLRRQVLSALVCLGQGSQLAEELDRLNESASAAPARRLGPEQRALIDHPALGQAISELMITLTPYLPEMWGPTLTKLDVGKRNRIGKGSLRNEALTWLTQFGQPEMELYVGGPDGQAITAIPGARSHSLVLGEEVQIPLSCQQRMMLALEAYALGSGTTAALWREPREVAALIVAACKLGGTELDTPALGPEERFFQQLSEHLPRKLRRSLADLAAAVRANNEDPLAWAEGARLTLDRVGALATGDISWVVLPAEQRRTETGGLSRSLQWRVEALIDYLFGDSFQALQEHLGLELT